MKALWVALALPLGQWGDLAPKREALPAESRVVRPAAPRWPFVVLPGGAVAYLFSASKSGKTALNFRFHYSS